MRNKEPINKVKSERERGRAQKLKKTQHEKKMLKDSVAEDCKKNETPKITKNVQGNVVIEGREK